MTSRRPFARKIAYLVAIAVLLMPLYWLSHPATSAVKDMPGSPGGKLSQLRQEYELSQADIGEIDPTSVTMKLATLGMRGVAADILWTKAFDFKMKKDWTNLAATLRQITKLQPHFINIWSSSVTWNVSYNVSVEFDDYRERYRWVMRGIDFLKEGIRYNERQPRLVWDMGWTISQKIGRADESKQFRKLFKEDDDFHGDTALAERDNWLVGKKWYQTAIDMVDQGMTMMGKGPLMYLPSPAMAQMYYADALEKDGTFGERAKDAWATAAADWKHFGDQEIPWSLRDEETQEPIIIRLNEKEMHEEAAKKLVAQLDALQPGLREKLIADKREALPANQREALDTPPDKRTPNQFGLASSAEEAIRVTHNEVARKVDPARRDEAKKLAKEATNHETIAGYIERYRNVVNFDYWKLRAQIEQSKDVLDARQAIYEGDRAYDEGSLEAARNSYEKGLVGWRKVLDQYPSLVEDQTTQEDLAEVAKRYRQILGQLDETFPQSFILQDILDANQERLGGGLPAQATSPPADQ